MINNPNCLPDRNSATQKKINLSKRQIRTISLFLPLGFRTKQPFHHFMAKATQICLLDIITLYHFNSQPIFSPDSLLIPLNFSPEVLSESFVAAMASNTFPSAENPNFLQLYQRKKHRDVQIHEAYQFLTKIVLQKKERVG